MKTAYQIPKHDEMPSDEMLDFLYACDQHWDGDESGVTISLPGQEDWQLGGPGDWIVKGEDGIYRIVREADYVEKPTLH